MKIWRVEFCQATSSTVLTLDTTIFCCGNYMKKYGILYCIVDCKYSDWSSCSKTCGVASQSRMIEVQAQNGGQACDGPLNKQCWLENCPNIQSK